MKDHLPISDAANYLGVSPRTLRRWEKKGRVSPFRTNGNQRRYDLSELNKLKENGKVKGVFEKLDKIDKIQEQLNNLPKLPEPTPAPPPAAPPPNNQITKPLNNHSHPAFSGILVFLLLLVLLTGGAAGFFFVKPEGFKSSLLNPLASFLLSGGAKVEGTMRFLSTVFFGPTDDYFITPLGDASFRDLKARSINASSITSPKAKFDSVDASSLTTNSLTTNNLTVTESQTVKALNADFLDSLDSTSFLRSDTSDAFTAGTLTIGQGTTLSVAGGLSLPTGSITSNFIADAAVTSIKIADGTITNSDVAVGAAIDWTKVSKTGSSLADLSTRSASDLSSGTLADARLSTNVPLKNTANTFTAAQTVSNANLLVTGTGNVGIGTVNLQTKLDAINKVHDATIPTTYVSSITNAHNTVNKYGLIVGTNWAAAENFVANFGSYNAVGGAFTSYLAVKGDGNVGIGTTSPDGKLHVQASDLSFTPHADRDDFVFEGGSTSGMTIVSNINTQASLQLTTSGLGNTGGFITYLSNPTGDHRTTLATGGTDAITMNAGGVKFPNVLTTATAANAFLDSAASNNLLRSTSSLRYKNLIGSLSLEDARKLVLDAEPIVYTSKAKSDNPLTKYVGFAAEQIAELDNRFVTFNTEGLPDWVQYPALTAPLTRVVQDIEHRLSSLETKNCVQSESSSDFGLIKQVCSKSTIEKIADKGTYAVKNYLGEVATGGQILAEAVIGNLRAGFIQTSELLADTINVNNKIISPVVLADRVEVKEGWFDKLTIAAELWVGGQSLGDFVRGIVREELSKMTTASTIAEPVPGTLTSDQLTVTRIEAAEGIFQSITAKTVHLDELTARLAEIASATIQNLTAGFIKAEEVQAQKVVSGQLIVGSLGVGGQTSGVATVKIGESNIFIKNDAVKSNSKIFVTFKDPYKPAAQYWADYDPQEKKVVGTDGQTTIVIEEGFTVTLDQPVSSNARFDWWVVN